VLSDRYRNIREDDKKTGTVTKWPLKGLHSNYATALNERDHRLFTITRKPPMMVVLETESGKEVTRLRAAGECKGAFASSAVPDRQKHVIITWPNRCVMRMLVGCQIAVLPKQHINWLL